MSNQVYIPLSMSCEEITQILLINFKKNQDEFYNAIELQYLQNSNYRIVAYCHDGYVDVIDDIDFDGVHVDKFEVAGNGLKNYSKSKLGNVVFEKKDNSIKVQFEYVDYYNRNINVKIEEIGNKESKGMNILAPIGSSSKNPKFLPLYMLYDFDFVCENSMFKVTIDDKQIDTLKFPLLKDWQRRMFTRYSLDTMLIRFAEDTYKPLVVNGTNNVVVHEQMKLYFHGNTERLLQKIELLHPLHDMYVMFDPPLPNLVTVEDKAPITGNVEIIFDENMGKIEGSYTYRKTGNQVSFSLKIGRWKAKSKTIFDRIMMNQNTLFSKWVSNYEYEQIIDLKKWVCTTKWKNGE